MVNLISALVSGILLFNKIPTVQDAAQFVAIPKTAQFLSSHKISLDDRWDTPAVNDVFRDNILLNLAYFDGKVSSKGQIDWNLLRQPSVYHLTLNPQETFAFHDSVLPAYQGKIVKTTNAHFRWDEGFKSDGYLIGDGVCHFASLINWSARDAGLDVNAPTNHDFMKINEIPMEYGVSIFANPNSYTGSANQNLYITNNLSEPVDFKFDYDGKFLEVSVWQL